MARALRVGATVVVVLFALPLFIPISSAIAGCYLQCNTAEVECSEKCCKPLPVASCNPESPCRKECATKWSDCIFRCPPSPDEPPKHPK